MTIPIVSSATATTMRRAPTTAVIDPGITAVLLSVAAYDRILYFLMLGSRIYTSVLTQGV